MKFETLLLSVFFLSSFVCIEKKFCLNFRFSAVFDDSVEFFGATKFSVLSCFCGVCNLVLKIEYLRMSYFVKMAIRWPSHCFACISILWLREALACKLLKKLLVLQNMQKSSFYKNHIHMSVYQCTD